ncbi:hypothetical protein AVEN_15625-1, partial [Araneus ventricosus]
MKSRTTLEEQSEILDESLLNRKNYVTEIISVEDILTKVDHKLSWKELISDLLAEEKEFVNKNNQSEAKNAENFLFAENEIDQSEKELSTIRWKDALQDILGEEKRLIYKYDNHLQSMSRKMNRQFDNNVTSHSDIQSELSSSMHQDNLSLDNSFDIHLRHWKDAMQEKLGEEKKFSNESSIPSNSDVNDVFLSMERKNFDSNQTLREFNSSEISMKSRTTLEEQSEVLDESLLNRKNYVTEIISVEDLLTKIDHKLSWKELISDLLAEEKEFVNKNNESEAKNSGKFLSAENEIDHSEKELSTIRWKDALQDILGEEKRLIYKYDNYLQSISRKMNRQDFTQVELPYRNYNKISSASASKALNGNVREGNMTNDASDFHSILNNAILPFKDNESENETSKWNVSASSHLIYSSAVDMQIPPPDEQMSRGFLDEFGNLTQNTDNGSAAFWYSDDKEDKLGNEEDALGSLNKYSEDHDIENNFREQFIDVYSPNVNIQIEPFTRITTPEFFDNLNYAEENKEHRNASDEFWIESEKNNREDKLKSGDESHLKKKEHIPLNKLGDSSVFVHDVNRNIQIPLTSHMTYGNYTEEGLEGKKVQVAEGENRKSPIGNSSDLVYYPIMNPWIPTPDSLPAPTEVSSANSTPDEDERGGFIGFGSPSGLVYHTIKDMRFPSPDSPLRYPIQTSYRGREKIKEQFQSASHERSSHINYDRLESNTTGRNRSLKIQYENLQRGSSGNRSDQHPTDGHGGENILSAMPSILNYPVKYVLGQKTKGRKTFRKKLKHRNDYFAVTSHEYIANDTLSSKRGTSKQKNKKGSHDKDRIFEESSTLIASPAHVMYQGMKIRIPPLQALNILNTQHPRTFYRNKNLLLPPPVNFEVIGQYAKDYDYRSTNIISTELPLTFYQNKNLLVPPPVNLTVTEQDTEDDGSLELNILSTQPPLAFYPNKNLLLPPPVNLTLTSHIKEARVKKKNSTVASQPLQQFLIYKHNKHANQVEVLPVSSHFKNHSVAVSPHEYITNDTVSSKRRTSNIEGLNPKSKKSRNKKLKNKKGSHAKDRILGESVTFVTSPAHIMFPDMKIRIPPLFASFTEATTKRLRENGKEEISAFKTSASSEGSKNVGLNSDGSKKFLYSHDSKKKKSKLTRKKGQYRKEEGYQALNILSTQPALIFYPNKNLLLP